MLLIAIIFTLHEALELLPASKSVTILTNRKEPDFKIPDTIKIDTRVIKAIDGTDTVTGILFADGQSLPVSGLFVAVGIAGSSDWA